MFRNGADEDGGGPGEMSSGLAELAEKDGEIAALRAEINRLNTVVVNMRAGYGNASPAALGFLAERARQRRAEGFSDADDDEHVNGEMLKAAICYLLDADARHDGGEGFPSAPELWPFPSEDWKRKPLHRQIEIAGALLIAEAERRDRNGLDEL